MSTENVDRGDDWTPTDDPTPPEIEVKAPEPEPKAEPEVVEEVKPEPEPEPEETKGKAKDTRIPAARHKEILDRERERREAVEAELAKYKQGGKIADVNAEIGEAEVTLVTLEAEYAKQMIDGEHEKAAATMTKIRRTERAINEKSAMMRETAAEARAVERVRYDTTVERLEALYPALDVDHEDFDKAKTDEVMELMSAYQTKGYTPTAALQKAVKLIMPPETKKQEDALKVELRVDPAAVEKARKAAAVGKVADAIANTPASLGKAGMDSDKAGGGAVSAKDVLKMSYKDFAALDETTLAKMRGDVI